MTNDQNAAQMAALRQIVESWVKAGDKNHLLQVEHHRNTLLERTPKSEVTVHIHEQLLAELTIIRDGLRKLSPPAPTPVPVSLLSSADIASPGSSRDSDLSSEENINLHRSIFMNELKQGDIVTLLTGGPCMTVARLDGSATCIWFDNHHRLQTGTFDKKLLFPATADVLSKSEAEVDIPPEVKETLAPVFEKSEMHRTSVEDALVPLLDRVEPAAVSSEETENVASTPKEYLDFVRRTFMPWLK